MTLNQKQLRTDTISENDCPFNSAFIHSVHLCFADFHFSEFNHRRNPQIQSLFNIDRIRIYYLISSSIIRRKKICINITKRDQILIKIKIKEVSVYLKSFGPAIARAVAAGATYSWNRSCGFVRCLLTCSFFFRLFFYSLYSGIEASIIEGTGEISALLAHSDDPRSRCVTEGHAP